jgi:hypothetical protein
MVALSLDSAKNIAVVVVLVFLVLAVVSAWLVKSIVTKLVMVVLMGGLALGAWTQRTSLTDCADKAKANVQAGNSESVTCRFFGTDVKIP